MNHFLHWFFSVMLIPVGHAISHWGQCIGNKLGWHCRRERIRRILHVCCHPYVIEALSYMAVLGLVSQIFGGH